MTTQNDVLPGESATPAAASSPPTNKRLAPRSSNQFRIGPPFCATINEIPIYNSSNSVVTPKICARLDRGFNFIDGEWIGYKRNYFTLVASFFFADCPLNIAATDDFFYYDSENRRRDLSAFKIMLTSVCPEDNASAVTLVQHTAKRDRGPQNSPPVYYAVPGQLPPHLTMKSVANIRNGEKIDRCNRLFYLSQDELSHIVHSNPACILAKYPRDQSISLVSRYERIQFSSAGCGNRKSASTNNKHYILVIQLLGENTTGQDVVLAYSESPPLVVRGRSPSNYPTQASNGTQAPESMSVKIEPNRQIETPAPAAALGSELRVSGEDFKDLRGLDENVFPSKKARTKPEVEPKRQFLPSSRNPNLLGPWDSLDPQLVPILEESSSRNVPDWVLAADSHSPSFLLGQDDVFPVDMQFVDPDQPLIPDLEIPNFPGELPDLWDNFHQKENYPRDLPNFLKGGYSHDFPEFGDFPRGSLSNDSPELYGPMPVPQTLPNLYGSPGLSEDMLEPFYSQDTPNGGMGPSTGVLNERMQTSTSTENHELVDLEHYSFVNTYSTYQALPAPVIISDPLYTSTPLQLKIESKMQEEVSRFHCNQVAHLNPNIKRCKHGFKARTKKQTTRLYSMEDLQWPEALDAGYVMFKHKLESFRQTMDETERDNLGSSMISTLTTISSNE